MGQHITNLYDTPAGNRSFLAGVCRTVSDVIDIFVPFQRFHDRFRSKLIPVKSLHGLFTNIGNTILATGTLVTQARKNLLNCSSLRHSHQKL